MGFDIMMDSQQKPWLLEVNSSPAMSMDGVADERVKPDLLRDTFRLIDFEPYDVYRDRQKKKNQQIRQERNGIKFGGNMALSNHDSNK